MTEINGTKPYLYSGIEEGDMITKVNDRSIATTFELVESINKSKRRRFKHRIYTRWKRIYNYNEAYKN